MKGDTMREALDLVADGRRADARRVLRLAGMSANDAAAWVLTFEGRPALYGLLIEGPLDL